MLLNFFTQSVRIAGPSQSRLTVEMVVEMLHEEQDEEDEAILSTDSDSVISDADDLDYVPQGQSGVVGVNPALVDEEDSFDDIEDLSDESSEDKTQTQSDRMSKRGSYWSEHPPPLRAEQEATTS